MEAIISSLQEQMIAQFQVLQQTLATQQETITTLSEEIATLKSASATPPKATLAPPGTESQQSLDTNEFPNGSNPAPTVGPLASTQLPVTRSDRLPDPPIFKGKRADLPGFLFKLSYKLEGNADRYPTPRSEFLYACSLLEGDAAELVRPLLDKDIGSLPQLVSFLESTYGDPNRKATAQTRLANLKQGKRGFLSHFAEFRRLAVEAGLNEDAQILQLRVSLNPELQKSMVGCQVPDTITAYANVIATYDNDLRFLRSSNNAPRRTAHHPNTIEINKLDYTPAGSAERERRRQKGLCFKCGSNKHISPNCKESIPNADRRPS